MTRRLGPILVLLVLLGMAGARWVVRASADKLLAGEAHARATVTALAAAARDSLAHGGSLAGLRGPFPAAAGALTVHPELGNADITYASDALYFYGLASHAHRDAATGATISGFVLRAWPADFSVTGDLEYEIGDDGTLWEGQNRTGRSGTDFGFPPPFPDPLIGVAGSPWWPAAAGAHR